MEVIYNNYFLRKITRHEKENISVFGINNLQRLLSYLVDKYGDKMAKYLIDKEKNKLKVAFLINGVSVSDFEYEITDTDTINIFRLAAGG